MNQNHLLNLFLRKMRVVCHPRFQMNALIQKLSDDIKALLQKEVGFVLLAVGVADEREHEDVAQLVFLDALELYVIEVLILTFADAHFDQRSVFVLHPNGFTLLNKN